MCGIWACFGISAINSRHYIRKLSHRGPDGINILYSNEYVLGFTHLSINGNAGMQPIVYQNIQVICNGEIYNYKKLAKDYNISIPEGGSDCSILPELFQKVGDIRSFCRILDGVFAMIIVEDGIPTIIRDPYGVRPLFREGTYAFSSEAKALPRLAGVISQFTPGCFMRNGEYTEYHTIPWVKQPFFDVYELATAALRTSLLEAVKKRLLSDKPIGALLSGGLDSSLIVSILSGYIPNLQTFSIGLQDSEDLRFSKMVAEHCKTKHTQIVITHQEYLDAIPHVIESIESADVTTVRASVGNWLLGKHIRAHTDIKVVFNGDGSDEVGGGYRYFKRAPSDIAFEDECVRLLKDICYFDGLRSDRCISAHGLEPRTPYLDKQFVQTWLSIPTIFRKHTTSFEKLVLRHAFMGAYLPACILYRKKEAFSDGMSKTMSPWGSIPNEEEYYKSIYDNLYPDTLVPYKWMPKWSPETTDPSARTLQIY